MGLGALGTAARRASLGERRIEQGQPLLHAVALKNDQKTNLEQDPKDATE